MNKIVVYTAIFNNYDWLKEPCVIPENIDFVCFTDTDSLKSKNWKIVKVEDNTISPSLLNRKIKLLYPYTYFKDYEYSLYVDGSVMIKGDVGKFLSPYLAAKPILMNFKHPNNDCIFVEMERCIQQGRGNAEMLKKQFGIYKANNMPKHFGMSDNKIILRRNCKESYTLMSEWYDHVSNYSGRDQVCLSYVLWKHALKYNFFDEIIEQNEYFETWPHRNAPWYMVTWRKMKWYSERSGFGVTLFSFLNKYVKPLFLRYRGIKK